MKYYTLDSILEKSADYNIIFGERSNGKTYAALLYGLTDYVKRGKQTAYVRRWREDIRGKRADTLFNSHVEAGAVSELTRGKYNSVFQLGGKWYLCAVSDDGKKTIDETPFCYGFALSEQEHEKSTSYPNVETIIFDEFLTRRYYLPDEFILFMNLLSTIIRNRDTVKVFMLGNTVNKFCPYFVEMGLRNVQKMEQGTIDVYRFGTHGAVVAVEYAANIAKRKPSNKYFCFDNENLKMITCGKWELAIYPHLPRKYTPKNVLFVFYIEYSGNVLQGNVIGIDGCSFIYIHRKTTEIRGKTPFVYSTAASEFPNYHRRLISSLTKTEKMISRYFAAEKVFYQDNEVGEIVRNYIMHTQANSIVKV